MSTAGGSDLLETLGMPTSPVSDVDTDAAGEEQADVDGAEGADEVKYDEAESMVMVGGADALELAYHAARGVEPTEAWGKSSVEAYPGDEQYATILLTKPQTEKGPTSGPSIFSMKSLPLSLGNGSSTNSN